MAESSPGAGRPGHSRAHSTVSIASASARTRRLSSSRLNGPPMLPPSCHVAVTSVNGAKGAAYADWSPLAGRHVVIWPDADPEGAAYADVVAKLLVPITASVVRVTSPAEVAKGWDAADALAEGWDRERAKAFCALDAASALPAVRRP